MDQPVSRSVLKEVQQALGLAPTLYQDLLQPAVKEMGQELVIVAKAVGVALSPLKAFVWGSEKIGDFLKAKLTAKLAHKPAHEIQTPSAVIAGPVMLGLAFAGDKDAEHLREMYANLLATAMHQPSAKKAHPSFVNLIQQLSPSEARLLQEIAKITTEDQVLLKDEVLGNPPRLHSLPDVWRKACETWGVSDAALADTYYINLLRLGIFQVRVETTMDVMVRVLDLDSVNLLFVTPYGKHFLDVCVRNT